MVKRHDISHHYTNNILYNTYTATCRYPVAVSRTGVRGARLVPLESRGPQNLFDVHRSAKPTVNLRHSVGGGGGLKTYSTYIVVLSQR
ncbi:hypothetical protein AVEN_196366-1 [Araneus ventricosus]|uniref:Uncharacterized protein n=1 Tax=Araneus ventricosus TaxID=182803 RepID=A0A4Y2AW72_ARAVE|nr:hypothetical protein AVEN_196366-1 [Araneus ventricosus]